MPKYLEPMNSMPRHTFRPAALGLRAVRPAGRAAAVGVLLACVLAGLAVPHPLRAATPAVSEAVVQRTIMPDAGPSSFAISFPEGVSLCFDPVRLGINYAWLGTVDLDPAWTGKNIVPAKVNGRIFYREPTSPVLRLGDRSRPPAIQFQGYALRGGHPEFHYTLDGHPVRESLHPLPDGTGFERRFRVTLPPGVDCWLLGEVQPNATMTLGDGRPLGEGATHFVGGGVIEFTVVTRAR